MTFSAEWVVLGFVGVFCWAPRRSHARALLLTASLALPLHLLPGDRMCCSTLHPLERVAFAQYAAGKDQEALATCQVIQTADPMNASVQYLAGLIAIRNGNNGLPMIHEAARRGSGLAMSYLQGECPCRPIASSGGTAPPGN